MKRNKISNTSMKSYAALGSPWRTPLSRLKYWVVVAPFITHDCWYFKKSSVQVIKFFPKQNFFQTEIRKLWSGESKTFSISMITRNSIILKQPLISIMSEINIPISPINLFFTEPVCCEKINVGKVVFHLFKITFDEIFVSTFNKEIGLQFFI